jgi:hypothetical protein
MGARFSPEAVSLGTKMRIAYFLAMREDKSKQQIGYWVAHCLPCMARGSLARRRLTPSLTHNCSQLSTINYWPVQRRLVTVLNFR